LVCSSLSAAGCGGAPDGGGDVSLDPAGAEATDPVRLVCVEPVHDFGTVWEGATVEHAFELEVQGDGQLKVEAVRASCGCTNSRLLHADGEPYVFGTPLSSGDRLRVDVVFQSQNRQGPQNRPVTLYGNLPDGGRFQVELVGEVGPYLSPAMQELELGRLLVADERTATVELRTADGAEVGLVLPPMPNQPDDLHAMLATRDGRDVGSVWTLAVRLSAGGKVGSYHWPIRVETRDPDGQRSGVGSTVFGVWDRVEPVASTPRVFALGTLEPGTAARATVYLKQNVDSLDLGALDLDGALLDLDRASADLAPHLTVERVVDEQGVGLTLDTEGLPESFRGRIEGRVLLPIGIGGQAQLAIPIDALVGPRR
ncbi:MAG: DUF1573 domain-containing protein, partial [Planctomycetota bacterium]